MVFDTGALKQDDVCTWLQLRASIQKCETKINSEGEPYNEYKMTIMRRNEAKEIKEWVATVAVADLLDTLMYHCPNYFHRPSGDSNIPEELWNEADLGERQNNSVIL